MTLSQRAVLTSLTVVLAYGGFGFACPQWTVNLGLDVWNCSDCQQAMRRSKELDDIILRTRQRVSLKILIIRDLIAKRINLADATEQFLELNKAQPETVTDACRRSPAASHEESVARQVISYVRVELSRNPSFCQEVVGDLEQQLQEMRGCNPLVR